MKIGLDVAKKIHAGEAFSYSPKGYDYAALDAVLNMDRQSPAWGHVTRAIISDVLIIHHLCHTGVVAGGEAIEEDFKKLNIISMTSQFSDEDAARAADFALKTLRATGYKIESIHEPIYKAGVEQPSLLLYMKILGVVYPGYEQYFQDEELHQVDTRAVARTGGDFTQMVSHAIKTETDEEEEAEQDARASEG